MSTDWQLGQAESSRPSSPKTTKCLSNPAGTLSWPKPNNDTGGEFLSPTQAACSRAANREQRVRETGAPAHQSSSRMMLSAAAVRTCCRWAFA
jgi:hypothetical protein